MSKEERFSNDGIQPDAEQTKKAKKHKKKKRRKSPVQIVLTVILVLLVLVVSVMIAAAAFFYGMTRMYQPPAMATMPTVDYAQDSEETNPEESMGEVTEEASVPTTLPYTESGKDIINVLVVGQSGRKGEEAEAARYADTAMLFTVNKNTKTLTMTSFLRDAWVKLPDFTDASGRTYKCGTNRINTAYALGYQWGDTGGAMQMMNETIYNNFGVEVDYNIEVDFEGFIAVIDSIGGVEIEIDQAEADYLNKDDLYVYEDVEAGKVKMNGMTALSYARMRKASGDGDSDIKRTARQRNLIVALLKQVSGMSFDELRWSARYAMTFVTTNMTKSNITTLLWEILPLLPDLEIASGTCPVQDTYWGEIVDFGGTPASVLKFSESQNKRLMQAITEGIIPEETTANATQKK